MTSPESQSSAPQPSVPEPETRDRVYRSSGAIAGGVLMLAIVGWLGIDAVVRGQGRTPWVALAVLILAVPLIVAFTFRPAVYANDERVRVRNPFRVIVVPWGRVAVLRSSLSNEVITEDGAKYQLWALPVSLRGRKRAGRREARATAAGEAGAGGGRVLGGLRGSAGAGGSEPVRAEGDRAMDDLRALLAADEEQRGTRREVGDVSVRWAYEVVAPAVAGAILLTVLLVVG
ncbi:PH domain-containing protein [Streptomyces sp. NPDC087425]|uniref:PH domain-containing protein n=1 Tax=Streptomyces sp. NPDC087425 TaxID=3365787 RepID=UPI0038194041